jgi:hypothetical protein
MTMMPDIPLSEEKPSRTLLGVLVDVSHSMSNNWHNKNGKELPRIEVVRDTLNRKLKEEQMRRRTQQNNLDNIDVFCLGMGFRFPMYIEHDILTCEQEQPLKKQEKTMLIDLICDLLALCEILPSKEKLGDFKERLNQKWQQCTKDVLDQSVIVEDVHADLVDYVHAALYDTAMQKHQRSLRYRFSHRKLPRGFRWVSGLLEEYAKYKDEKITTTAQSAANQYADDVVRKTTNDFTNNAEKYAAIIQGYLDTFVQLYTASTLQAFTLGFTPSEIVDDLDEKQALSIAGRIYVKLDSEVKKHIELTIKLYQEKLLLAKRSISASLDKKELNRLTRRLVQKYGWDILKPLIEDTVYDMVSQHFESQAKKSFPHWIRLASAREIVRPLTAVSHMLPNIIEEHIYSEEVMFGATPLRQAIDRAAIRFIDEAYKDHKKVLLIISDGEFREEAEVMVSANLLKRRGVTIISCLIHDRNLLSRIVRGLGQDWPSGAKRMIDIASEIPEQNGLPDDPDQKRLARTLTGKKLCYQINHSKILDAVIDNVFEENPALGSDTPQIAGPKKRKKRSVVVKNAVN